MGRTAGTLEVGTVGRTAGTPEVGTKLVNLEHKDEEEVGVEKSTPHNETIFQIGIVV